MDRKKLLLIIGSSAVFLLLVTGIIFISTRKPPIAPTCDPNIDPACSDAEAIIDEDDEITLNMWGVFDDSIILKPLIDRFNKAYPNIKIVFSKKDYSGYEDSLIDEIATGGGPDIFTVNNYWIPKHRSKMSPADSEILSIEEYNQIYIPSVYDDFVMDNKIYGLPLYTDNLALFYNQSMFGKASIYDVPKYWDDVLNYSRLLTVKAPGNPSVIDVAGIALGTSANINRSEDILLAMMMQTATPIISNDKRSYNFNQFRKNTEGIPEYPGTNALNFYTSFANPEKGSYSWSADQMGSIDAFANEKVSMILGYNYFIPLIEKANPQLNYRVTALPQIKGAPENITVANYWGWSVSRNTKYKREAWLFLKFLSEKDIASDYLQTTQRVSPQKNFTSSGGLRVFEEQKTYTKNLFKSDAEAFDIIFNEMIDDVIKYKQPAQSAIDSAARKANEMLTGYY